MKIGLIVIGVLLLVALLFGGKLVGTRNDLVTQREADQRRLGAGGRRPAAARRSDPESGRDGKGLREARAEVFTNIANARVGSAERAHSAGEDRGQHTAR